MNRTLGWVIGLVVVVALVWGFMMKGGVTPDKTSYKAVFLTNGQVYFGKVTNESVSPVVLKDIYYLQVQQQLQQAAKEGDQAKPTQQIQLVKLGNEIHGPKDEMRVNKDQVLMIETLKDDGQVVKAIKNFQANGSTSSPAPTETTTSPAPTSTKK